MNYNSWNSELNSKSYNDFFISRYNLSLSPIQQDFSSKSHTLYTNLGINYNNFKTSINIKESNIDKYILLDFKNKMVKTTKTDPKKVNLKKVDIYRRPVYFIQTFGDKRGL